MQALREPESHTGMWKKKFYNGPELSLRNFPGFWPQPRALLDPEKNWWCPFKISFGNFGCFPLDQQRQTEAARQGCRAVLLHQLERLVHAHEAQVCVGDSFCEYDGARQPISWIIYWSACPIGLKRRGVHLNYEEFVLHNTIVSIRLRTYIIYNT